MTDRGKLRSRAADVVAERLAPERTRRPTRFERLTVARLGWATLVRLNAGLEVAGRVATGLWVAVVATAVIGLDWRGVLQDSLNSGRPVRQVLALGLLVSVLVLLAVRSMLGFARWRVQRELWRRDVARMRASPTSTS